MYPIFHALPVITFWQTRHKFTISLFCFLQGQLHNHSLSENELSHADDNSFLEKETTGDNE